MGQDQDPGPGRRGHARLARPPLEDPPPRDAAQAAVLYRAAGVLRERFPAARDTAAALMSLAAVLERPGGGPPAQPPPDGPPPGERPVLDVRPARGGGFRALVARPGAPLPAGAAWQCPHVHATAEGARGCAAAALALARVLAAVLERPPPPPPG